MTYDHITGADPDLQLGG